MQQNTLAMYEIKIGAGNSIICVGEDNQSLPSEQIERLDQLHGGNIWQTLLWTKLLLQTRYIDTGYVLQDENMIAFFQKRSIGMGQYGLFCVGGPMKGSKTKDLRGKIQELCRKSGCLFVQIEPIDSDVEIFPKKGAYKRFIEPSTAIIDLAMSDEEILASMKSKGRYNIRLGTKHDLQVRWSSKEDDIHAFCQLLDETTSRNQFSQNSHEYYRMLIGILTANNLGGLLIVKKGNDIVAAGIFSFFEKGALYYYGASPSDNTLRKYMGSYTLQWTAIQEAKKRGCATFDFLGIADEQGKPKHLAGVTDFKMKFGPQIHKWPDAQIYVAHPFPYRLMMLLRRLRKMIKQ